MQRVRMSLPYFKEFGWEAEVVTVDEQYSGLPKDELLLQSLPVEVKIHRVKALDKGWTTKFGLGSLALRSLWFYREKVDQLLKETRFDLIYFSTTQFPLCILGQRWKKKFGVPYVIDMQDPWHSEYYRDKPKHQQPPKYWFSYRLNKYLEPIAMKQVDGLISVSKDYITDLKKRYPVIGNVPSSVITFGYFRPDVAIAHKHQAEFEKLLYPQCKNLVYVGRGGMDMHAAITPVFLALKRYLMLNPDKAHAIKLYFIGTSYAPAGTGTPTVLPLAKALGIDANVVELTNRISFYHTLATLQQADALFVPGSDDPKYTASKLYPYLLAGKPLLAVFHAQSPALETLQACGAENAYAYHSHELEAYLPLFFDNLLSGKLATPAYNVSILEEHSARNTTRQQCQLFDTVMSKTVEQQV